MEIQTDLSGENRLYLPREECLKTVVAMASSKKDDSSHIFLQGGC